jgi:hypothetical protein
MMRKMAGRSTQSGPEKAESGVQGCIINFSPPRHLRSSCCWGDFWRCWLLLCRMLWLPRSILLRRAPSRGRKTTCIPSARHQCGRMQVCSDGDGGGDDRAGVCVRAFVCECVCVQSSGPAVQRPLKSPLPSPSRAPCAPAPAGPRPAVSWSHVSMGRPKQCVQGSSEQPTARASASALPARRHGISSRRAGSARSAMG